MQAGIKVSKRGHSCVQYHDIALCWPKSTFGNDRDFWCDMVSQGHNEANLAVKNNYFEIICSYFRT